MARKADTINKELYQILHQKMVDEGWSTIRSFTSGSRIPISLETVRRAMSECDYKGIAVPTIAIIAQYLGFTPNEIRDLLKEHTSDNDFWQLIGDHTSHLTKEEECMLSIYRTIKGGDKRLINAFATQLQLLSDAYGVTFNKGDLASIKR